MGNSCKSVLPNTCAWEQQKLKKTKQTEGDGKTKRVNIYIKKYSETNEILKAYSPPGVAHPEAADELPNEPNRHL